MRKIRIRNFAHISKWNKSKNVMLLKTSTKGKGTILVNP